MVRHLQEIMVYTKADAHEVTQNYNAQIHSEYKHVSSSGSIRFNTDSAKMEIYNGEAWWEIDATSPEQQTGGTRGLFWWW